MSTPGPLQPSKPSAARQRILDAADHLFYAHGIRTVSVERVIVESRVTRITFYRHFPSKDDLIAAYLEGRLDRDRARLAELSRYHPDDPHSVLTGIFQAVVADASAPGFRGCPYANLAVEYRDEKHPARAIATRHRTWLLHEIQTLLERLGVDDADLVAEQLVMVRAGAMALATVGMTPHTARALDLAWTQLLQPG